MGKCGRIRRYMTNRAHFTLYPWSCNRVAIPKNKISKETARSCYFLGARKFDTAAKTSTVLKNRKHVSIIKESKLIELKNTDMIYEHLWKSNSFIYYFLLVDKQLAYLPGNCGFSRLPTIRQDPMMSTTVTFMMLSLRGWRVAAKQLYIMTLSRAEGVCLQPPRSHTHIVIKLVSSRHMLTGWFNIYLPLQACALQLRCPPCLSLI